MDNLDKGMIIEKFINTVNGDLQEIKLLISLLNIEDDKQRAVLEDALNIFERKIKKIKRAKNIDDLKRHLKVKKVINNYDNGDFL